MRCITAILLEIVLCLAGARAHEGQGGEPGHWEERSTGVKVWHTHGPSPEQREAHRREQCAKLVKRWRRFAVNADGADAYAYRKMSKKCADRETPAGKAICAEQRRRYEANRAGLVAGIRVRREKAAEVCKPEEMRPR